MPLPLLSGEQIIKILVKDFGFYVARQKGSHIALSRNTQSGKLTTIVPDHRQVQRGTLRGILKLARIGEEEFTRAHKK